MLTYTDIAKRLRIPENTLRGKLIQFNKVTRECDQVKPDVIEDHPGYRKHLFNASTVPKIQAALKSISKPVGRPRKPKQNPKQKGTKP